MLCPVLFIPVSTRNHCDKNVTFYANDKKNKNMHFNSLQLISTMVIYKSNQEKKGNKLWHTK